MKKLFLLLSSIFCLYTNFSLSSTEDLNQTALEAKIGLLPAQPSSENIQAIQPGTPILITVKIKNNGKVANKEGQLFVRFVYPEPLSKQPKSELFVTETIGLPSIQPGKEASLMFKSVQFSPTLYDFVKEDFAMRQYQAVLIVDNQEYILGNTTLTFSAYYYSGQPHEIEVNVPKAP